jgi:hypothetical protein
MRDLYWLASYPKSGNTWLRIFLANWFANAPEPLNINRLLEFGFGLSDGMAPLWQDLCGGSIPSEDVQIARRAEVQGSIPDWARSRWGDEAGICFVKTHNFFGTLNGYKTIAADRTVGSIYLVRDPRRVAPSLASHAHLSIKEAVEFMNHPHAMLAAGTPAAHLTTWSNHVRSWRAAGALMVRYEDLPGAFSEILRHLGLPDDPARLARAVAHSRLEELQRQEASNGFVEHADAFFGAAHVALPDEWARRIEHDHGDVMREFGYA